MLIIEYYGHPNVSCNMKDLSNASLAKARNAARVIFIQGV